VAGAVWTQVPGRSADTTGRLVGAPNAVLVARQAPGVPVVLEVDCGHVPQHLAMVSGALAAVRVDAAGPEQTLRRSLVYSRPAALSDR
jgi:muramoyltetrapeptide carboxypeptidase LdcA involved in peptidoglycan recycling